MKRYFTAVIEKDLETGFFIGYVPEIQGAHTQAESLDELYRNLKEVIELCLEETGKDSNIIFPEFVGTQQIAVEA